MAATIVAATMAVESASHPKSAAFVSVAVTTCANTSNGASTDATTGDSPSRATPSKNASSHVSDPAIPSGRGREPTSGANRMPLTITVLATTAIVVRIIA
jgi:hypothetical protein